MRFLSALSLISLGFLAPASAVSIDWSGTYRFEAVNIDSTSLGDPKETKSYLLNSLTLSPKIVAVDGINIVGTFQLMGNPNYPGSQVGQYFGQRSLGAGESGVVSSNQGSSQMDVRHLYLNINQEYGAIVAGRAPVQFGLGMTYNAGLGAFDHWGDSYDMVGYKFLVGNLSFMPMIAKPYDATYGLGRDVTDVMLDIEYNNLETESLFGVFHSQRSAGLSSNDASNVLGGTAIGTYSVKSTNILLGRGFESFKIKLEAGFQEGNTGLSVGGQDIRVNGYGIVTEMEFPRPQSKWDWRLKAGIVSGDNPTTTNFEGYALDRNYDVAFLMFNHPMGGYDVTTTNWQRQRSPTCTTLPCPPYGNQDSVDEDAISNTIFLAPQFTYSFSEKWAWRNAFVYAQVQTNPSTVAGNDVAKDLGYEWDSAFIYRPHERVQWVNELGLFAPGSVYKEGSVGRDNNFNWGFQTKASISF